MSDDGHSWEERRDPAAIAGILNGLLKGIGAPEASSVGGVFAAWGDIVGPDIAAHAQPTGIEGGVLRVTVDDPAWVTHLRWMQSEVVEALVEAVGEGVVERIELRVARPR